MSADLLAEFDSFYTKPQQPPQPSSATQAQSVTSSSDPFNFSSFSTASQRGPTSPPPQPWGAAQTTSSAGGDGWGDFSSFGGGPTTSAQPQTTANDDDGWGDFETAQNEAEQPKSPPHGRMRASTFDLMSNNLVNFESFQPPQPPQQQQQPQYHQRHQPSISSTYVHDVRPAQQPAPVFRSTPPKQRKQSDPNVLFDAEDFDGAGNDDDDFGDFETGDSFPAPLSQPQPKAEPQVVKPTGRQQTRAPAPLSLDLLTLDDPPAQTSARRTGMHGSTLSVTSLSGLTSPTSPYPQAPKSPSFNDRNPFPGLALKTPTTPDFHIPDSKEKDHSPTPVTAWPTFEGNEAKPEDWSPFEDFASDHEKQKPAKPAAQVKKPAAAPKKPAPKPVDTTDSWDWDAVDAPPPKSAASSTIAVSTSVLDNQGSDSAPPPTNIPPPSVLLSIFPQLLSLTNTSLFKPLAGQPQSIKDRVTADPATATFLRAYLLLATVAGRIVAGRKLRWHRDRFLSQGMAISAAGAKGMKLAGVDRTQAAREDREAGDLVGVWHEQVGRLRSAVAAANGAQNAKLGANQLRVPELAENLPVTTAKMVATAPKPCVVCGLKRDERVAKVDFDVEDSFGEWWVEHWGHRACKNFWIEHEKQLRSR